MDNKKYNKGLVDAYDKCIELIDNLIRNQGKSNIIAKREIEILRNSIVRIQEEIDNGNK